jgi:hypothetical protein
VERADLHRLIGDAIVRAGRTRARSRASVDLARESAAALERTVARIRRDREARAAARERFRARFGNRQLDARIRRRPG